MCRAHCWLCAVEAVMRGMAAPMSASLSALGPLAFVLWLSFLKLTKLTLTRALDDPLLTQWTVFQSPAEPL